MKSSFLITSVFFIVNLSVVCGQSNQVHQLLDQWHHAAAVADEDTFFGSMTKDAIYLGTDPKERWTKDEFRAWSKKIFEREKAWDFTPYNRHIYFSGDGKLAWFDESLKTWMGICRGSGVLKYDQQKGWKIAHYNLSVTIDNDKMKGFLELQAQQKK